MGHTRKILEKMHLPRHQWLKEVDQAPEKSDIRKQKDKYMRELGIVHKDIQGLFKDDIPAQKAVAPYSDEERRTLVDGKQRRGDLNEAMRMYRLLRPDAPPFFEEDAMLGMKAKMNKILLDEAPDESRNALAEVEQSKDGKMFDPYKAYLPVVNQRAFLLALESVAASLAEDVETMCLLAGLSEEELPKEDDPLRFKKLLDALFGAFPLRKDPSRVDEFMQAHWPRLRSLLPEEVAGLKEERVADWLRGHLRRVQLNQRRHKPKIFLHAHGQRFGDEEWYSIAEDFVYDDDPMPGELADERNLEFPLQNAGAMMGSILQALSRSPVAMEQEAAMHEEGAEPLAGGDVAAQFQDFVWDLEKIGLRSWLKMDTHELERFLPKGELAEFKLFEPGKATQAKGTIPIEPDDINVAKLMLRCAARGRPDLLDFEAVDPYKLLHGLPAREVDEELKDLPPHEHLGDEVLGGLVEEHRQRLLRQGKNRTKTDSTWLAEGATIDEVYRKELDFYRTAGPVEWTEKDGGYQWQWRQPPNTFWDERRKVYIQQQKGVDPSMNLREMRQHMLDLTRMSSMVKNGRINYFRAITMVGNGKGVYGFGVGFGNTPKEAKADAALKALQKLDYIDMDIGRMLPTPVKGQEYKHTFAIVPRPIGRGIQANKKHLPLAYILGLDNCKLKFTHAKIFTRIRAIKRALDMVTSRRTLANMTGKRYALLVAPGDHWVHWPDRWFDEMRKPYDQKSQKAKLARRHALHFKKRAGSFIAVDKELKPGWRKERWSRWVSPLERWLQHRRGNQPFDPKARGKDDPAAGGSAVAGVIRAGAGAARVPAGGEAATALGAGGAAQE